MNGHLRRCRFGIPPHVRPQSPGKASYLQETPSTLRGDSSLRLASGAFLNRLQYPNYSDTLLERRGQAAAFDLNPGQPALRLTLRTEAGHP